MTKKNHDEIRKIIADSKGRIQSLLTYGVWDGVNGVYKVWDLQLNELSFTSVDSFKTHFGVQ